MTEDITDRIPENVSVMLSTVQRLIRAPKDKHNSFGKYDYRNCEDILEAAKKVMPEGASIILTDNMTMLGDRFYIEATAVFTYKGNAVVAKGYAREPLEKKGMDSSQITGSTSSYARKYALSGLLAIDNNDDPDAGNGEPETPQFKRRESTQEAPKRINSDQAMDLVELIHKCGKTEESLCSHYKVNSILELTVPEYAAATGMLKNALAKKEKEKGETK